MEFEAQKKDGKIIIKTKTEKIVHPDGKSDVIIHAPSLDLIGKFIKENKEN